MSATTPKDMVEAIETCIRLDADFELDEWEENFFTSVQEKVQKDYTLSEKQLASLEKIYDRT